MHNHAGASCGINQEAYYYSLLIKIREKE